MGFEVLTARKGIYVDGHEWPDIIESRNTFFRKMVKNMLLAFTNAPTEESRQALPEDIDHCWFWLYELYEHELAEGAK